MTKRKTLSIVASGGRLTTTVGRCTRTEALAVPRDEAQGYIDTGLAELAEADDLVDDVQALEDQDNDSAGPDVTESD